MTLRHSRLGARPEILLVEDFRPLLLAMQRLLESVPYKVLAAKSAEEALRLAQQSGRSIHLLVTRLLLPGMIGSALASRVRMLFPNLAVLYMSDDFNPWLDGPSEPEIRAALLPNPFSDEILLQRVNALLGECP